MFDILDPATRKNKHHVLNISIPLLYVRNMENSYEIAFLYRKNRLNIEGKQYWVS